MLQLVHHDWNVIKMAGSWAFARERIGITLAGIALVVSIINALTGISNFVLSRFRLIRVRQIRSYFGSGVTDPKGSKYFEVDLLSYGAAVWDLSVEVVVTVPLKKKFMKRGFHRTYVFELPQVGGKTNPLNAGQAARFCLKRPQGAQTINGVNLGATGFGQQFEEIAAEIPRQNICLNIYSGCNEETRTRLRRVRSWKFHWALNNYCGGVFKIRFPWLRGILANSALRRSIRKSKKITKWIEDSGNAGANPEKQPTVDAPK